MNRSLLSAGLVARLVATAACSDGGGPSPPYNIPGAAEQPHGASPDPTKAEGPRAAGAAGPNSPDSSDSSDSSGGPSDPGPLPPLTKVAESVRSNLQWKRADILEADLRRALELSKEELCQEFDLQDCVSDVHLVALGGNDPFDQGLWVPAQEPLGTTSIAIDRVVLKACDRRVDLDEMARPGDRVLSLADYAGPAPAPSSGDVRSLVTQLYRRLLGRDPVAPELDILAQLARDTDGEPVSGATFARSACYAIGTTAEFVFF